MSQIAKGEMILNELLDIFQSRTPNSNQRVEQLSNSFYTTIPHNIGRSKQKISSSVIDSMDIFIEKQELLQLMRDILNVTIGIF